jgi:hypothetical protein
MSNIKTQFEAEIAAATSDAEVDDIVDATVALVSRRYDRFEIAKALAAVPSAADRRAIAKRFLMMLGEA